jgi:PAS domain S-box-containing protein
MPYSFVVVSLGITALLCVALGVGAYRQRTASGAVAESIAILMLAVVLWIVSYTFEIISVDPLLKGVWHRSKYLLIVSIPVIWFAFSALYTGRERWVTRRRLLLLLIVPAITTLLMWTNPSHNLVWVNYRPETIGEITIINSEAAIWFWVHSFYSYGLIVIGTALLVRQFAVSPRLYRLQLTALFVAVAVPFAASAATVFGGLPIDLAPFAFTVTGVSLLLGLLRYQFLDLLPVAREMVINGMSDGMIVLDRLERIVELNPAAQKVINRPVADLIGQPITQTLQLLIRNPDLAERYRSAESIQDEIVLEGDTPRYLDVRVSPLLDNQQRLTGRVIVFRDITERKNAEQRIQAQNDALVKANHELIVARKLAEEATLLKSQFLATMSHELRTPLNAIIGYTEIQLEGMTGELSPEQQDYQKRVLANGEHLLSLINDVLDISKIEAGRFEIVHNPFNLRDWMNEIVRQNRGLAEEKGLLFDVDIDPQLPETLIGDSARLKQIVINLVSNAVKFTEKGAVKVNLSANDADSWKIAVTDSGIGIPPHAQDTIFDEFRQLDSSSTRQYGGTGLGLAIVKKLVLLMGGKINLKSETGEGSTFTITIPYVKEVEATLAP